MSKTAFPLVILGFFFASLAAGVSGDYLEVRTSDIYTGPCFANAEVNLTGKEAILAWRVREGRWQDVELKDLTVVAVVKAQATLGDPHASPDPARAVIMVDERANPQQSRALVSLARSMSGSLLDDVVWVKASPIEFELGAEHGHARLQAGDIARFETRGLHEGDHLCGNETVYYPPLVDAEAIPAYTTVHEFTGSGLNSTWSSPFKRSAFIGHFRQ